METQTPRESSDSFPQARIKTFYWLLAAGMTITATLDFVERKDALRVVSGFCLVATFVLIATSRSEPGRIRKVAMYALLALSIALTVARWFAR
jgi:FtsH-binding integral membrane protein